MNIMPVLFVGHGSPMNAIEDNSYSQAWSALGQRLPRPKAILAVSAHWYVDGVRTQNALQPTTIYDMYGFPEALYQVKYPAPGAPELAERLHQLLQDVVIDNTWGIDHGTWSVLHHMLPKADIPLCQLSVDTSKGPEAHYALGKLLAPLRKEGVLIIASGNIVHNLRRVRFDMDGGFDWAKFFDEQIRDWIMTKDHDAVCRYREMGDSARLSVPTPDHFNPLLYALGAAESTDTITIFNEAQIAGSLSMTSYAFGL